MKFSRFLASKSIALCIIAIGLICWCAFAVLVGVWALVIGITVAAVAVCTAGWLAWDYISINVRLKKLNGLCAEIEEGYLLGEVLPKPVNGYEEEYFKIMKFVSRSAVGFTEEAKREREEYCDYVELWIHEIKTPLTACSLIIANGGDMRKLKAELKRAENLTENILYCARLRTLEADTQISAVNVINAVDNAVKSQMELLVQAGVCVETEGDIIAHTDGKALEFILQQFLVNCAKYCKNCTVKITAEGKTLIFGDNGGGIPSHELSRIFDRGFVGSAGRACGGGTGMGLYLVRELCGKLAIGLEAQSEEGKFTRFVMTFKN